MNISKLNGIIPNQVLNALTTDFLVKTNINGPLRLSNFLGQTEEESGKFTREVENLNYRAQALLEIFPSHFSDINDATSYDHQPEKIANRIYANRMGNGDDASGDGWKYRGRGDLQITGKANYQALQNWLNQDNDNPIDLINNPDLIETAPYDLLSAAWFFTANNIWSICDKGVDETTVSAVTRKVNGGETNLAQRIIYTQQIHNALTA